MDENGFEYFDELPPGTRLATLDDFHKDGRLKVDMCFLVHHYSDRKFGIYYVKKNLTSIRMKPFIAHRRVYVFVPEKYKPSTV